MFLLIRPGISLLLAVALVATPWPEQAFAAQTSAPKPARLQAILPNTAVQSIVPLSSPLAATPTQPLLPSRSPAPEQRAEEGPTLADPAGPTVLAAELSAGEASAPPQAVHKVFQALTRPIQTAPNNPAPARALKNMAAATQAGSAGSASAAFDGNAALSSDAPEPPDGTLAARSARLHATRPSLGKPSAPPLAKEESPASIVTIHEPIQVRFRFAWEGWLIPIYWIPGILGILHSFFLRRMIRRMVNELKVVGDSSRFGFEIVPKPEPNA